MCTDNYRMKHLQIPGNVAFARINTISVVLHGIWHFTTVTDVWFAWCRCEIILAFLFLYFSLNSTPKHINIYFPSSLLFSSMFFYRFGFGSNKWMISFRTQHWSVNHPFNLMYRTKYLKIKNVLSIGRCK